MKTLNVLAAFIGGAIAGAALGILFAPEKGEDTRGKIAQSLRDHGVKLSKEDFEKLVKDIQSKLTKKKDIVEEIITEDEF
ncbi:MAG: YtxH domain-containing protein [Bacteroidaceae bacterium]|nr:YtxH domain-containing protein [Bacteroidaceae bacterium]